MKVRIHYHHTDCGGLVYYGQYLNFLEEARTEFFEGKGISVKELAHEGIVFVAVHQEVDYKAPAFYGDTLEVSARIVRISSVRIEFEYEIKNQRGQLISSARTVMACVSMELRPRPIPGEIRKKLQGDGNAQ